MDSFKKYLYEMNKLLNCSIPFQQFYVGFELFVIGKYTVCYKNMQHVVEKYATFKNSGNF